MLELSKRFMCGLTKQFPLPLAHTQYQPVISGNVIFSGFDLTGLTVATQTSVGTLSSNTLSEDEVEFTVASDNADLAGAGMRVQIVFRAVGVADTPAVSAVTNTYQADVPIAPNNTIEVRFTVPIFNSRWRKGYC